MYGKFRLISMDLYLALLVFRCIIPWKSSTGADAESRLLVFADVKKAPYAKHRCCREMVRKMLPIPALEILPAHPCK